MEKILKVNQVTKYYGSIGSVTRALDGVTFDMEKGDFTAVMGASGSGKSTLLNVIATIDKVSSGEILLQGKNVMEQGEKQAARFRREELGFVFQEYNLLDTLTIGENIVLPLNLMRVDADTTKEKLDKVAQALSLTELLERFPWEVSGGQRQRAACARAIVTSPALVLADEPTGALDSATSKNLMNLFRMMNTALGATILLVTHDAVVGSYAKRILFLKDGKIWSEIYCGKRTRKEMYQEILHTMAALGGDVDVC